MADIDQFSQQLGRLQATIEGLTKAVDHHTSRVEADSQRMARKLDEQDSRLDTLSADMRSMSVQLAEVSVKAADSKIVTDDVKRWRQLGLGAIGMVGVAAAWVGANGAWLFETAMTWFKAKLG